MDGGNKNGSTQVAKLRKMPWYYPTKDIPKLLSHDQKPLHQHVSRRHSSPTPGSIPTILTGRTWANVFFSEAVGQWLATCDWTSCPPIEFLCTEHTRSLSSPPLQKLISVRLKIPKHLTDTYFKKQQLRKPRHQEGDIFDTEKVVSSCVNWPALQVGMGGGGYLVLNPGSGSSVAVWVEMVDLE